MVKKNALDESKPNQSPKQEEAKMINKYSYQELREKALSGNQDDVNALGYWFSRYGERYWNGEFYDADGFEVVPQYQQIGKDEFEIVGYEIR